MTELTTSQLIKILLGIFVVVVVVIGVFLFFRNTVIDFIKNLPGEEETSDEQIGDGSQIEQDDGEKFATKEECEKSSCNTRPPEDLKCNVFRNVKGYLYECNSKGECERKGLREEVEDCVHTCSEGICTCLEKDVRCFWDNSCCSDKCTFVGLLKKECK
jgi:hypothetical protein